MALEGLEEDEGNANLEGLALMDACRLMDSNSSYINESKVFDLKWNKTAHALTKSEWLMSTKLSWFMLEKRSRCFDFLSRSCNFFFLN